MDRRKKLKICFMGGKKAGIIGAKTILSRGDKITAAVGYSKDMIALLKRLKIPIYITIRDKGFIKTLKCSDLLVSVHSREIVKKDMLKLGRYGALNVHPYLYKYKGANPVGRAFADNNFFKASVGVHVMEEEVDTGAVLYEKFVSVWDSNSVQEIYKKLYRHYRDVIFKTLDMISNGKY